VLRTLLSARTALESARGTPVTPTRLLYFESGAHEQEIGTIRPVERRNSFFESFRSYPGLERNRFTFRFFATYDQLAFWLALAVKGGVTGTGAGADKTWAYVPSASTDDLKSCTLQFGYADGIGASKPAWEVAGCMVTSLSLRWEKGGPVMGNVELISHKGATQISAFTGALSDRSEVDLLGTLTSTFVDASTMGSTADANITSAEFTVDNKLALLDTLNGTNTAASVQRPEPRTWALNLTRVYANDTERDAYVAKTLRKVRIRTLGPTLGATNYKLDTDCYGIIDKITSAEVDGIGAEAITILPQYDSTATTDYGFSLVNSLAAIT
jgi:hypothetical protein